MNQKSIVIVFISVILSTLGVVLFLSFFIDLPLVNYNDVDIIANRKIQSFDGLQALKSVEYQVESGPRVIGSKSHDLIVRWIAHSLDLVNWDVEIQEGVWKGVNIQNIVAKWGSGTDLIIVGSHFDSRIYADKDSDHKMQSKPVPGANDGASSVAVLLELARILDVNFDTSPSNLEIWFVFFDAEDNGGIDDFDWILGSEFFVSELSRKPDSVVILDMIGDRDLTIYREKNSNNELTDEVWSAADELGYSEYFINAQKHKILDDHIPFVLTGIPAIDVIDFDYPYWHTSEDTLDKISSESLQIVGDTIYAWIISRIDRSK